MCLLDSIKSWNKKQILCVVSSHQKENHPLRNSEGLPMTSLIEYGAQAIAVHGCLSADNSSVMKEGYLVALRDIKLAQGWLSDIQSEIEIFAECIYAESGNMIYSILVHALTNTDMSDEHEKIILASGRITVMATFN
ncbi:MAG TPA: 3-hydroxylacyl-ACP dehydratase [Gammaproteobacteria bacterium]|nr:3-hydroxylacyl-ACP dehydratase [Gammaproteobacteria bacterium]